MEKSKVVSVTIAKDFFAKELRSIMEKRKIQAEKTSFDYLVELLLSSIESDLFFAKNASGKLEDNFLVGLYAEYLQGTPESKKLTLKRLGDVCLMVTGFFPDSLNRKVVDVDYYFGMGGSAYGELAKNHAGGKTFEELSIKFKVFSNVLGEVSERSGLHSNGDLLRLYERWLHTGSDRIKEILSEKGIHAPLLIDVKTRN
jgi:hypothetical protein